MAYIYIILGLTLIIFIHELGHFLAARWAGVRVLTFSIGIGPRLFTVFTDKKKTEYIISLIPLGGYVRMKGQEDLPVKESYNKSLASDHYLSKSTYKRMVIILAGVLMNFVLAYFLIIVAYSLGVSFSSNEVGGIIPNLPASHSALKVGDEIIGVNGTKVEAFEEIATEIALLKNNSPLKLKVMRNHQEIFIDIPSTPKDSEAPFRKIGITPKLIPSVESIDKNDFLYKRGLRPGMEIKRIILEDGNIIKKTLPSMSELLRDNPSKEVTIMYEDDIPNIQTINKVPIKKKNIKENGFLFASKIKVLSDYPAFKAGLVDGDVITKIGEKDIRGWQDIIQSLKSYNTLKKDYSISIMVKRGEEFLTFNLSPYYDESAERFFIGISPYIEKSGGRLVSYISEKMKNLVPGIRVGDEISNFKKVGLNNEVTLLRNGNNISFSYSSSTLDSKTEGYLFTFKDKGKIISYEAPVVFFKAVPLIFQEFKNTMVFIKRLFSKDVPLEVLGGPIAIFETSYIVHQVKGWAYFILLFAKISISIAIINLLPIPALDGGHAVFTLYEMVRKKPVPENVLKAMHLVGFALLVFLMIYVNYNDVIRVMNR